MQTNNRTSKCTTTMPLTAREVFILRGRQLHLEWQIASKRPNPKQIKIVGHMLRSEEPKMIIYQAIVRNDTSKPLFVPEEHLMPHYQDRIEKYLHKIKHCERHKWEELKENDSKVIKLGKDEQARRVYLEQIEQRDKALVREIGARDAEFIARFWADNYDGTIKIEQEQAQRDLQEITEYTVQTMTRHLQL